MIFMLLSLVGCTSKRSTIPLNEQEDVKVEEPEETLDSEEMTPPVEGDEEQGETDTSVVDEEEDLHQDALVKINKPSVISEQAMKEKVLRRLKKDSVKTVYTKQYQSSADDVINKLKAKQEYTLEQPLLILNPYGTMETSLYMYYSSEHTCNVQYRISVDNEAIPDITATFLQQEDALDYTHEGTIVGLIPGVKNYVTIYEKNEAEEVLREIVLCINLESYPVEEQTILATNYDKEEVTPLNTFALLLSGKESTLKKMRFYDVQGILRCSIPVTGKVHQDMVVIPNGIVFPKDSNTLILLNALGKAEGIYSLSLYRYENGLVYDEAMNCIYMIASIPERDSVNDIILKVDLLDGTVTVVIDLVEAMGEVYVDIMESQENVGKEWIQLDSLSMAGDDQLLVSSELLSSIICLQDLQNEEGAKIGYIVSDHAVWNDTQFTNDVYQSIGTFEAFRSPRFIQVYTRDKRLIEGQYYVYLYNDGQNCYKIFVDENTKTYTLADRFDFDTIDQAGSINMRKDELLVWMHLTEEQGVITIYDEEGKLKQTYEIEERSSDCRQVKWVDLTNVFFE